MKINTTIWAAFVVAALPLLPTTCGAASTDISSLPISSLAQSVAPNTIFGIDDSGSMDFEVLMPTNDGALWWNLNGTNTTQDFWDTNPNPDVFVFNTAGTVSSNATSGYQKFGYLFPNGSASDGRSLLDTDSHYAIPPIPKYAYMRSSAYNPMYYNPSVTYVPWVPAYIAGATRTFANASTTAARSHPWFPASGTATTTNLSVNFDATNANFTANNYTFRMVYGMTIPWSSLSGMKARRNGSGSFTTVSTTTDDPVNSGEYWDVAIPYLPATYYVLDNTCSSGTSCFLGPDGRKLRQYKILSGTTFPSGRTYAAELQNFANWFTYYRKRDLFLASAAGQVFSTMKGFRGGTTYFNATNPANIAMYDFGATSDSANVKTILGAFDTNLSTGGTPTRGTLNYIGQQIHSNTNIVQYACQRNNAFILTDGFADQTPAVPTTYSQATWINSRPYTVTTAQTLSDIAAAYYTINPRTDLPVGKLSIDSTDTTPGADKNPNLHMNTYALTLGAVGTIYGTGTASALNPYTPAANYPTWPSPNVDHSPTAVDDLWHATINGRGSMFTVTDSTSLVTTLQAIVNAMLLRSGADSSIGVSNVNVRAGDNIGYVSNYNGQYWSGELAAYPIDTTTGAVTVTSAAQIWEARDQLTARTPSNVLPAGRLIATYNGSAGIPFEVANLPAAYLATLNSTIAGVTQTDNAAIVAYLRGDRTGETAGTYRTRFALLGDIVDAAPVVVNGASAAFGDSGYAAFVAAVAGRARTIYVGANDGMLHAFDASSGAELWSYVPSLVPGSTLNAYTTPTYTHTFSVDGTPTVGDVYTGGAWKTMLVGGLNAGGNGYFALDVTTPAATTETLLSNRVMWEFPNAATSVTNNNNMGLSFGRAVLAKTTASGWVVLVTSGYNNGSDSGGDGKGYLFVLNAATGAVIQAIPTTAGTSTSPSGLAQISGYAVNPNVDATVDYVYGGDLQGNLWRFDLTGTDTTKYNVKKLASLVDGSGVAQPITTTPELVTSGTNRLIVVGTGELLGQSDIASTQTQSIYAVIDNMTTTPTIASPRTSLQQKAVTVGAGGIRNIPSDTVDFTLKKGWYFDLPSTGERLTEDITAVYGALVFVTNQTSTTACNATSYIYVVQAANGGQVPSTGFASGVTPWTGLQLANAFGSQPVLTMLASGAIAALTHLSDNTLGNTPLPFPSFSKLQRVTWKEVLR